MDALAAIDTWGAAHAAAAVVSDAGTIAVHGPQDHVFALASVTKVLVAYAALVAVEEGSIALDEPAGPPGATVRHLLAHTAGYPFDGRQPIAPPGARRIYSNTGFEVLGEHLEAATAMAVGQYVAEAVLDPLGAADTTVDGSPASSGRAPVADVAVVAAELLRPTLVAPETMAAATAVQFLGLAGILPGFGRLDPLDWGLGFELRYGKAPHWTGTRNSPATFGHFGAAGTFVWVDPVARRACVVLTDKPFGPWAVAAWGPFSDAVLTAGPTG